MSLVELYSDQRTDVRLVELYSLRRRTESKLRKAGAAPATFVSVLRKENAALSRPEKSLGLARAQGTSGFPVAAKQMRLLFGPRGGAARRGVLVAAAMDVPSDEDTDFEVWVAHRKAKYRGAKKRREDGETRISENEVNGGRSDSEWTTSAIWRRNVQEATSRGVTLRRFRSL